MEMEWKTSARYAKEEAELGEILKNEKWRQTKTAKARGIEGEKERNQEGAATYSVKSETCPGLDYRYSMKSLKCTWLYEA